MALANQGEQSYLRMKREDRSPCLLHACSSNSAVHTQGKAVLTRAQVVLWCIFVGAEEAGVAVKGCPVWTWSWIKGVGGEQELYRGMSWSLCLPLVSQAWEAWVLTVKLDLLLYSWISTWIISSSGCRHLLYLPLSCLWKLLWVKERSKELSLQTVSIQRWASWK